MLVRYLRLNAELDARSVQACFSPSKCDSFLFPALDLLESLLLISGQITYPEIRRFSSRSFSIFCDLGDLQ